MSYDNMKSTALSGLSKFATQKLATKIGVADLEKYGASAVIKSIIKLTLGTTIETGYNKYG